MLLSAISRSDSTGSAFLFWRVSAGSRETGDSVGVCSAHRPAPTLTPAAGAFKVCGMDDIDVKSPIFTTSGRQSLREHSWKMQKCLDGLYFNGDVFL